MEMSGEGEEVEEKDPKNFYNNVLCIKWLCYFAVLFQQKLYIVMCMSDNRGGGS